MPNKLRVRFLTAYRNMGGKIGIAVRYIFIKTLAKGRGRNVFIK